MRKLWLLLLPFGLFTNAVKAQDEGIPAADEDTFRQCPADNLGINTTQMTSEKEAAPAAAVVSAPEVTRETVRESIRETTPVQPRTITQKTKAPPIDIDGYYQERRLARPAPTPRQLTETDKIKIMRAKLEKQNEVLMRRQIEKLRMKQELEMSKRIQKTFDDSMKRLETLE